MSLSRWTRSRLGKYRAGRGSGSKVLTPEQDAIDRGEEGIQEQLCLRDSDIQGRRHFDLLVRSCATTGEADFEWRNRVHYVSILCRVQESYAD